MVNAFLRRGMEECERYSAADQKLKNMQVILHLLIIVLLSSKLSWSSIDSNFRMWIACTLYMFDSLHKIHYCGGGKACQVFLCVLEFADGMSLSGTSELLHFFFP